VFGRKSLHQGWLKSADNPSDDPTREVELRAPENFPEVQHLLGPDAAPEGIPGCCLEVFAGTAGLTQALRDKGLQVERLFDAYPAGGGYDKQSDLSSRVVFERLLCSIKKRKYRYVHFGCPCTTFSVLRCLTISTRTKQNPEGNGSRPDEIEANQLLFQVCLLCAELVASGGFFSIENPRNSFLWKMPCVLALDGLAGQVVFDQCEFGLRLPGNPGEKRLFLKKPTTILSNVPGLESLSRHCKLDHAHGRCMGSCRVEGKSMLVSKFAGAYPPQLCSAWASVVARSLAPVQHTPRRGR
jgi:hypothetical protein